MKKPERIKQERTLPRLLRFCTPYKGSIAAALVFAILYVGLNLTVPILVGYAIDNAVEAGKVDFGAIGTLLLGVAVTAVCSGVFQWLMNMCTNTVVYFTVRDLRRQHAQFIERLNQAAALIAQPRVHQNEAVAGMNQEEIDRTGRGITGIEFPERLLHRIVLAKQRRDDRLSRVLDGNHLALAHGVILHRSRGKTQ